MYAIYIEHIDQPSTRLHCTNCRGEAIARCWDLDDAVLHGYIEAYRLENGNGEVVATHDSAALACVVSYHDAFDVQTVGC